MTPQTVETHSASRAARFIVGLLAAWTLVSNGTWAQEEPCRGCAPGSQPHALSLCFISSGNDYNTGYQRYFLYDTDPQTAVNHACQAFAEGHWVTVVGGCALDSPPVNYSSSGGTQIRFRFTTTFYDPRTGQSYTDSWNAPTCVCQDSLNPRNVGVGTDGFCHCKNGLQWDSQKKACVQVDCPVLPLKPLATDQCTQSLEAGKGKDKYNACQRPAPLDDPLGEPCLRSKLTYLKIPYSEPTSTIRTAAYQAHLKEVWGKARELRQLDDDPALVQACASVQATIDEEIEKHALVYRPIGDSHTEGNAFDISQVTVGTLMRRISTEWDDVETYLQSAFGTLSACNLRWGGRFTDPDVVHFYQSGPNP